MNLSAATRDAVAQHGLRVLSRLDVPPGRHYLLRIAGVDGGGNTKGSVQYDLDVPDFSKGPLDDEQPGARRRRPTWNGRRRAPTNHGKNGSLSRRLQLACSAMEKTSLSPVRSTRNDPRVEDIDVTTSVRSASGEVVFDREQTLTPGTNVTNVASGAPVHAAASDEDSASRHGRGRLSARRRSRESGRCESCCVEADSIQHPITPAMR